jgi:hypothetical protein
MVMVAIPGRALSGTHPVNGYIISKSVPNSNTIIDDFSKGFEAAKNNKKLEAILETFFGKDKLPTGIIP